MGAKTKYTEELADRICQTIATSEKGIHAVAKELNIPVRTIFDWLVDQEGFSHRYARAKDLQADFMAEETLRIADETSRDTIKREIGDGIEIEQPDHEWINRSKLRVDTRKWLMAKLAPKKYGDKIDMTSDGKPLPTPVIKMFPDEKGE